MQNYKIWPKLNFMTKTKKLKLNIVVLLTFSWVILLIPSYINAQVFDDFTDGDFTNNPGWLGETYKFQITNSTAIPPELKPALQLNGSESATTILFLPNSILENTEWRFWVKLSFNTSANNFVRIYLVSDQENLNDALNGYFVEIGGENDSIGLFRQQGLNIVQIIGSSFAFTGNSTNVLRIKVKRDEVGNWELFSAMGGGINFEQEGTGFDNTFSTTSFFGIYCQYTSSNATKFYFDDFFVDAPVIDTIPPEMEAIEVLSSNSLIVNFSENVEIISAENINNYSVNNSIGNPVLATRSSINPNNVSLEFSTQFTEGINYQLNISGISDLSGNIMDTDSILFSYTIPPPINTSGILINEIMADQNPLPNNLPEADYLELYNPTQEPVNLENFTIRPRETANYISLPNVIVYPDSFLIVTSTADAIEFEPYGPVVGISGFSLNNEGTVVLRNPNGNLVHAIAYSDDWYKDDEKKDGGWSLEQIDPSHPCIGEINWAASTHENGGTPGRRNAVDALMVSNPRIESVDAISENTLKITFSEMMDSLSIANTNIYYVEEYGNPFKATTHEIVFDYVEITFSEFFVEQVLHQLIITDTLWNCAGEYIDPQLTYSFVLPSQALPYDVVINEIMFDPEPPVELPAFEYIEIFNATNKYLMIEGWSLEIGISLKSIPGFIMEPEEYVIFTETDGQLVFSMYGRSIGFSSLGLSNSGTSVKLLDSENKLISFVEYSSDWISDSDKKEGGWSVEQVDPLNPCCGSGNWVVSEAHDGGTPGSVNSVDAENLVYPQIISVFSLSENTLEVLFNQSMDKNSLTDKMLYEIDYGIGTPKDVILSDSVFQRVLLTMDNAFQTRIIYTLSVDHSILNCNGTSPVSDLSYEFGKHEDALENDLVINEILFNPVGDGVDFVEIYNRSEKIINLRDIKLGEVDVDEFGDADTTLKPVSVLNQLILAGQFVVLTSNPAKVQDQYYTANPDGFLKMGSFPPYSNESGNVLLTGKNDLVIDAMEYDESMHFPLLVTVDGVTLERLSPERASRDATNWHSASKEVGFATPAYQNSQFTDPVESEEEVMVEPEIFSPDNDGYNDVLNIHYQFNSPGFTANITLFDAQGRQVKLLVQNTLLGTSGTFSWDGRTDDNQKAGIGIYIVFLEAFDVNGHVKKYKKTAVLAGRIGN
jgi:hypothetical protein